MTCVSIYSDAPIVAAGLSTVLAKIESCRLSGTYSDLDLLEKDVMAEPPHLLLMELTAGVTLDLIRRISSVAPAAAIVLWVGAAPIEFLSRAIRLGVRGILGMNSSVESHRDCIRSVAAGKVWVDQEISRRLLLVDIVAITPRERQLMGLLAQGLRNKEIARSLGITEGTVKIYLSRLFVKFGANDRLELALLALKNIANVRAGVPVRPGAPAGDKAIPFPIPQFVTRERPAALVAMIADSRDKSLAPSPDWTSSERSAGKVGEQHLTDGRGMRRKLAADFALIAGAFVNER
jgi:DNA-binding NarL/FixJ family response regulator